jgi:type IV fimbrial biogenesis protein FimT
MTPRLGPFRRPVATRGWTLIETLIVMTILGLSLSLSLPSFGDYLMRRRLEGSSQQLVADLQELRSRTVATGQPLRLRLQSDLHASCYLIHTGEPNSCSCLSADAANACRPDSQILRTTTVPTSSGLRLSSNVATVVIDPRHGTFSPALSIDLASGDGSLKLRHVVSILGRVRLCMVSGRMGTVPAC